MSISCCGFFHFRVSARAAQEARSSWVFAACIPAQIPRFCDITHFFPILSGDGFALDCVLHHYPLRQHPLQVEKTAESAKNSLFLVRCVCRRPRLSAPYWEYRDLRGALIIPKIEHHAAILDPEQAGEMLRAIDGYEGSR